MSKKKKKKHNHEEQTNIVINENIEVENARSEEDVVQKENETLTVDEVAKDKEVNDNEQKLEEELAPLSEEKKELPQTVETVNEPEKVEVKEETVSQENQRISTKNYDAAVVKLISEVKIFNDDDADLGIDNKRRIWPIILVLLMLGAIGFGVWYFVIEGNKFNIGKNKDNEAEEPNVEINTNVNTTYRYEEKEEGIEFYSGTELIDTYSCEGCKAYSYGMYEYFSSIPTVIAIQDGENVFLYDYTLKKVISENYKQLQNIKSNGETVLFIVTTELDEVGVMNIAGEVIIPPNYEALGYSISGGDVSDYDYQKDIITARKDGYWGAINFKGEEIIPFEYEDIYYNGYKGIAVYVEGYWYLHNLNNNRLIETGYDMIVPIKSYVFASVGHVFYVLNYKGESIIEKEVPTYLDTFRSRNDALVPSFKIEEDGTVVNIYIMQNETEYDKYKFNTVNGELTEIIQ